MSERRWFPELQTIAGAITYHAEHDPSRVAIACAGRELTYADLDRRSTDLAAALQTQGLAPGDRVAFLGEESVEYYALLVACAKAGIVLVPINFRLTAPEVAHILADSGSRIVLADQTYQHLVGDDRTVVDSSAESLARWAGSAGAGHVAAASDDPETAVVQLYTSGTTGLPKGAVLAQRSFFTIRDSLASNDLDWIDFRDGDVSLIGIPGTHVGGVWWSLQGFAAGITNVALPRFDAAEAVRLIVQRQVTTACVVPSMLRLLLNEPHDEDTFASLRKIVYGGSPISEALLVEAIETVECEFAQIYGLTETGNTAVCLPPDQHVPGNPRLRAAGRPYPAVDCRIVDEDGRSLGPGGIGEVCLRTPAAMLGYWHLPEATAATLVDGWIHTGDAGYLDADGYLFIHDRLKDMICIGGENVYPNEIENVLARHPAVSDAAVVGIPDDRFGEAALAFVAVRDGHQLRPRELLRWSTTHLAAFKIPSRFEFLDQIPRNPSGKILRRDLRAPYWRHHDRFVN